MQQESPQQLSQPIDAASASVGWSGPPPPAPPLSRLAWLWQQLKETANPNTMHTEDMTDAELAKQASFESLDYYKPYPDMYMEHLRDHLQDRQSRYTTAGSPVRRDAPNGVDGETAAPANASLSPLETLNSLPGDKEERHVALRWLLHVLIAFSVGIVATMVSYGVDIMERYRGEVLYLIMRGHRFAFVGYFIGYWYNLFMSLLLVAMSAGVVIFFEPAAAGGGIPDVMAYLNGVHLRKAMNLRTFIAKAISCICAVAGGLPVGLEAPLIHLGAITGAGVTQGRSRTLGFQTSLFQAFRNNKDRRDFITAGAACGVSVAFGAPIGGLLFVMEEVSSFWDHSSSGQIFLATMLAFTVSTIINSVVEHRQLLGWVSNAAAVLFEVNVTIPLNLVSIVPSLILGAVVGAMAALFTKANLVLIKWRRRVLRPYPLRRFAEPVVVVAIFSSLMYLLSLCSGCKPIYSVGEADEGKVYIWGTEGAGRMFNNTCSKPDTYSPLGTLNMASGKNTIRHLFSRQTVGEFGALHLLLYFIIYAVFACITSGAAVSGGLVVPSLVMGAVFGRLYGLFLWRVGVTSVEGVPRGYPAAEAWLDPGVFALIGAGAFLAGTSRMSMAICVIMVELSAELHYLLPVMVAIAMSKTVADWLSEPLYNQMMYLDCVPYLPANLLMAEFEQLTAADVMTSSVMTLRVREKTEVVVAALRDTTHHAFPVVRAVLEKVHRVQEGGHSHGEAAEAEDMQVRLKFVGLVTREDLQVYFSLPQLAEYDSSCPTPTEGVSLTDPESDGYGGRLAPGVVEARRMTWAQWTRQKSKLFFSTTDRYDWMREHVPHGAAASGSLEGTDAAVPPQRLPPVVDLSAIVNRSPWVIPPFFNLQMAYHTFRMMGLRHMVVVDGESVAGIITRKDLLVDALRRRMKALTAHLSGQDDAAPSLSPSHTHRSTLGSRQSSVLAGEERGGDVVRVRMDEPIVGLVPPVVADPLNTSDLFRDTPMTAGVAPPPAAVEQRRPSMVDELFDLSSLQRSSSAPS